MTEMWRLWCADQPTVVNVQGGPSVTTTRVDPPAVGTITDEQLAQRWPRIQPIVRDDQKRAWLIEPVDPSRIAYTWDPKLRLQVPNGALNPLVTIRVYISYGYYGLFKPTIRECLAQMPADIIDECVAFEIVKQPETREDLWNEQEALNAGFQVTLVTYYGATGAWPPSATSNDDVVKLDMT